MLKIIFLFVCIGSLFAPSNCFHFVVPRPELNVLDVHPFYYHDQYLLNNYSNTYSHTNSDDARDFSHKHSRTNIFAFIVFVTLLANHFNLLPN